ncbi:hypothetical protein ACFQL3_08075 [Natronoarchaeum sp. GCM10025321]|uniref:hypothetical protein n=1 Tax=Natronoarchaeum sp. GCM10025321 TaxID=3252684 RepID=UPI003621DFB3
MIERVAKATLLALYQLTIVIGIVLMPVAVALQRTLGRAPPLHRFIERVDRTYETAV